MNGILLYLLQSLFVLPVCCPADVLVTNVAGEEISNCNRRQHYSGTWLSYYPSAVL